MIRPSWSLPDVFALYALQKSMMLTPCGPSAVPTGGAGVALPAGICSFTCAVTFLAIRKPSSNLFHLQEIQFHRGCTAEDRHQDAQRVPLGVHFIDFARELRERTIDNAHSLVLFEVQFRTRPVG